MLVSGEVVGGLVETWLRGLDLGVWFRLGCAV